MIVIVTQCFPPDVGGIEIMVGGYATQLAAAGEAVTVLADRVRGRGLVEPEWPPGVAVRRFGGPRPLRRLLKAIALRALLRQGGVTCVVTDSWKSAALLPARAGVPVAILAHGNEVLPEASARRRRKRLRALLRGSVVAANSEYTAGQVRAVLDGRAAPRVAMVPPALPEPAEPDQAALDWARAEAAGDGPIIVTVARLEPRKGVDQVIRALPALAARHPGLRYLVAGGGPDRGRLEGLADGLGVAGRVRFLGRVSDTQKSALLEQADLFAMPARQEGGSVEGFGIVYLEAGWFGCPSLAGSAGGSAEVVANGVTGAVCDGADAAAVEASLAALLDDPARLQAMGRAAADRVRAEFLWPETLRRFRLLLAG